MGQPHFITAHPRPFPEGQPFLMTRDLSHEEEKKSEWVKLPAERDRARMKRRNGRKKKASKERVFGEGYTVAAILCLVWIDGSTDGSTDLTGVPFRKCFK